MQPQKLLILLIGIFSFSVLNSAYSKDDNLCALLRVNGSENPMGNDDAKFRLSWILPTGIEVDRYQVLVGGNPKNLNIDKNLYWDSGEKKANDCNVAEYQGKPIPPSTRVYWQVRVWAVGKDKPTEWSEIAYWETGLGLGLDAWEGSEWIAHVKPTPAGPSLHNELLRHTFELPDKKIASARLYVGTPGFFQAWVNGQLLSDTPCDPIPSRSLKRIYYRTFDVGDLLKNGKQTLGLRLFSGYYSPAYPETEHEFPVIRSLLKIMYEDGSQQIIGTNENWKVTEDYITITHRYAKGPGFGKEIWDMDDHPGDWTAADYSDSEWEQPTEVVALSGQLTGQPPVGHIIRAIYEPDTVIQLGINRFLLDFGKTITGRISGNFQLTRGRINECRLQYFDHWPEPNRYNQTDEWMAEPGLSNGGKTIEWKPVFNLRCFRYVELEYGGLASDWSFVAEEIGTLHEPVVQFSSGDQWIDSLYQTGISTIKALTINGIVTDCPHREKDGWGAELGANLDLLCSHFDAETFLLRYLIDCRDASFKDGRLPAFIPWRHGIETSLSGGTYYYGCPIETAWKGYLYYGNPAFIKDNFEFLYEFVGYTMQHLENGIIRPYHFSEGYGGIPDWLKKEDGPQYFLGDWLSPGRKLDDAESNSLFNTAYMIYASKMVKNMAELLNHNDEAAKLDQWIKTMSEGIKAKFINERTGKVHTGRQPYPVVVLLADFLPEKLEDKVYQELKRTIIEEDNKHFNTGVAASTWLLQILLQKGEVDLALDLIRQKDYPSLGIFLLHGFTTYPERWDIEENISFCHASFGGTSFWYSQALAGILPDATQPGFKSIILAPQFTEKLPGAKAAYKSHRGLITSSWEWQDDNTVLYSITIPNGSTGKIKVPKGYRTESLEKVFNAGISTITFKKIIQKNN